jgi:molecular chaperone GrpE
MAKGNGRPEMDNVGLDLEHELPASGDQNENSADAGAVVQPAAQSELQKVQAERDTLLDRLARMQAEFDNARKRTLK